MATDNEGKRGSKHRSAVTGRYVTVKYAKKNPATTVTEPAGNQGGKNTNRSVTKGTKAGATVVGRSAVTGRYVLAPAVKTDSKFREHKSSVVREVIKDRRDK